MKIALIAALLLLSACGGGKGSINGEPLDQHGDAAPSLSDTEPKHIVVFGGTSGIGLETVKLALDRGHKVTSITRRPERMELEHANLNNLKGDITKIETFEEVFKTSDVVISSIGLGPGRKPVYVYSKGMQAVLDAMQQAPLNRVITVTGIGAGDSKGHGGFFYDKILNPLMLKEDYKDKTRQEELLKSQSDVDWTIVRPGFLTDDAAETSYRVIKSMEGFTSGNIARADVAHFLLALAEQDSYLQETVFLTN